MNRPIRDNPSLQLGENTIESLTQAGALGAEYVEFGTLFIFNLILQRRATYEGSCSCAVSRL